MGHSQIPLGCDVSGCVRREHLDAVADVVLDGVDVAVLRVNVHAGVELQFGFFALNDPLRFGAERIRRSIGHSVEYADGPEVEILKKHFAGAIIESD